MCLIMCTRVILHANSNKNYLTQLTSEIFVHDVVKYRLGASIEAIAEEALTEPNLAFLYYKSQSLGSNSECKVIEMNEIYI